ncbi:MAG TPA: hypothetical protein VFF06_12695 [Polyangia bacterium]|nr:hypothetical protein [Polyangia bacterium]
MRALAVIALIASGCATTEYQPQLVARGELTLRYQGGFEMWGGGRRVARGLGWSGLPEYVRCVPQASDQAQKAARDGTLSTALSITGGIFGVLPIGALIGFGVDYPDHVGIWLGTGVGMAVLGVVLAGFGRKLKNSANGHAVDALNYYNDAVGSLGATCDDLRYPAPAAPQAPPPEYPPPPQYPQQPQFPPPQYPQQPQYPPPQYPQQPPQPQYPPPQYPPPQ